MTSSNGHLLPMEIIDDETESAVARMRMERFRKNVDWLQQHSADVYAKHRGKCICVAGEELFVGATPQEALALAAATHPDDDGHFVEYIPVEKVPRIYAS